MWKGVPTRLLRVSIIPDPDQGTLGHVQRGLNRRVRDFELGDDGRAHRVWRAFDPDLDGRWTSQRRLRPQIVELFAGVIAEKQFTGRRHNWVGASSDVNNAADLIAYIVGSERQARKYSDYLWVVAEDAVTLCWSEVELVATELLVRRQMSGRAVRELLRSVPAQPATLIASR